MNDCPRGEIRDLLPDLLHDRLDAGSRRLVETHVAGCAECSAELALLGAARAASLRSTPVLDVEAIARRVRTARTLATAPILHDRRRRRVPVWAMTMAAALLLLVVGTISVLYYDGGGGAPAGTPALVANGDPAEDPADPSLVFASQAGLFVGALADMDEGELESMLQFLPVLEPYPDEEPPLLIQGFSTGEG